ncbi:hypothetical protein GCM10010909_00030 [Acidocella aquatica]|uniref:Transposase n=1 Tax=Acidocella aquatica TaxID=1922313 RepID=A0ABQ6A340_9PROT|nr:hypothetical protein GCM10010909_00030 [Acidocella aquatica]
MPALLWQRGLGRLENAFKHLLLTEAIYEFERRNAVLRFNKPPRLILKRKNFKAERVGRPGM